MESPDPWELADSMGAPSKEEVRREMMEEEPEYKGCPLCGQRLDSKPMTFDHENDCWVHVDCLEEAKKILTSIDSDNLRSEK